MKNDGKAALANLTASAGKAFGAFLAADAGGIRGRGHAH